MKSPFILGVIIFCFFNVFFAQRLNAQCCTPDSLKVKSKTDSSFCVQWRVSDSARCDSVKGFQFQYRPTPQTNWITRTRLYHHDTTLVYCDTATACRTYNWRVRNTCIVNGDTVYSAWVTGANFTLPCHFQKTSTLISNQHNVAITPNPAHDKILVTGNYGQNVTLTIANMEGQPLIKKQISNITSHLNTLVSLNSLTKGIYSLIISDKNGSTKLNFIKE